MKYFFLGSLLLLGCTQFVKTTDDKYFEKIDNQTKSEFLNLTFSHNINGETHPCGCRNYPLGGLPQIAGVQHKLKEKAPMLYVDTGDTFFPSPKLPDYIKDSLTFTANQIAEALDKLELKYLTPGDQDFALGEEFLIEMANKHKFEFLLTNASNSMKIKHKKWAIHQFGDQLILFLGVVNPDLISEHAIDRLFVNPEMAIAQTLKYINDNVGSTKEMTVILLSHSGLERDQEIAGRIKQIDWIIGAHSQSFLRYSSDVNQTKIVQVLSRNHYLGHIQIPTKKQGSSPYEIIEVRDELKDEWPNNPFINWLEQYKSQLDIVQIKEQEKMAGSSSNEIKATPTANSCIECHQSQFNFWQSTSHALAYTTLEKSKANNNPACIGCHSLKFKSIDGFRNTKEIVKTNQHEKYWSEWNKIFAKEKTPRHLAKNERIKLSNSWFKLDKKFKVAHNYANVQCLNCHDLAKEHPFDLSNEVKRIPTETKCLECHTQDQSPEWYLKNDKGVATTLNKKYFSEQMKKIACPKQNE